MIKKRTVTNGFARGLFAGLLSVCGLCTSSIQAQSIPGVQTLAATNVTSSSAVLIGAVNPNGTNTGAWFRYGQTYNYGSSTPTFNISGTNLGDVYVTNVLTGLTPGTLYHYQCVATNSLGINNGTDQTFTTQILPPSIVDGPTITNQTLSSASVIGTVQPGGGDTVAWFGYGPSNYIYSTPATLLSGTSGASVTVSNFITGLSPTTIYRVRLFVTNSAGSNSYAVFLYPPIFSSGVPIASPPSPTTGLIVGDFDNNGSKDILIEGFDLYGILGVPSNLPKVTAGVLDRADLSNSGYLDAILGGQLWHNLGNGNFTNVTSGFPGSIVGDVNNDGKLDAIGSGIWLNKGNSTFSNINTTLPGTVIATGDFDKDGWLDLVCQGNTNSVVVCRNLGNGTFTNLTSFVTGMSFVYAAIGDIDNDGWPDIVVAGSTGLYNPVCQIWRNLGNGTFTNSTTLPMGSGGISLGDFDNDGRLDILGTTTGEVWHNQGNGNFEPSAYFYGYSGQMVATWIGTYQLNLAFAGHYQIYNSTNLNIRDVYYCQEFINNLPVTNTAPTVPPGLKAQLTSSQSVRLSWNPSTDAQTPSSGLNYNIRVGTMPGGVDVVSPMADVATGYRRIAQTGNAQQCLFAIVTNLPPATYYWSVQAIDTAWAGSPFAAEEKFSTTPSISSGSYGSDGKFHISFDAFTGSSYTLKVSTNFVNWSTVTNAVAGLNGKYEFMDDSSPNFSKRFYRLSCP